jgi:hypothetical protein
MALYNGTKLNYPPLPIGCVIISIGLKLYYNGSLTPFFNSTVSSFGQTILGTGVSGTISNPSIDESMYNGNVRYRWEVVTSCAGLSVHETEVNLPFCTINQFRRPNDEIIINNTLGVADYFITEHFTGSKWVDGKDIYRKVIELSTPSETVLGNDIYFIDSTIGYDSLLDARGIIKVGNGMTLGSATFPIAGASHLYVPALQDIPNNINAGDLVLAFSAAKVTYIQIIIEYTK